MILREALTPSWGKNHESADVDAYCDDDQKDQCDPGNYRDVLKRACSGFAGCVRRVHVE
jgi:hypothetical protein